MRAFSWPYERYKEVYSCVTSLLVHMNICIYVHSVYSHRFTHTKNIHQQNHYLEFHKQGKMLTPTEVQALYYTDKEVEVRASLGLQLRVCGVPGLWALPSTGDPLEWLELLLVIGQYRRTGLEVEETTKEACRVLHQCGYVRVCKGKLVLSTWL